MAAPKFPVEAQTTRCPGRKRLISTSALRPLKHRSGFAVSTFTRIWRPRARQTVSSTYWGVFKKTGSMSRVAASMRATLMSVVGHHLDHHGVLERHEVVECGRVERNLANPLQHPARRHALAAREREDLFAQVPGSSDGRAHAREHLSLGVEGHAGRDNEVGDRSKGRAAHAVDVRVLRG